MVSDDIMMRARDCSAHAVPKINNTRGCWNSSEKPSTGLLTFIDIFSALRTDHIEASCFNAGIRFEKGVPVSQLCQYWTALLSGVMTKSE